MVVTAAVAAISVVLVSRSPVFDVRHVDVAGNDHLRRPEVVRLSGITGSTDALWIDAGAIERRLESEPWIASARVHSSLPDAVEISLVERTPVAVVRSGAGRRLVAADGTVVKGAAARGLPTIVMSTGRGGPDVSVPLSSPARAVAAISAVGGPTIRSVVVAADGTLSLHLLHGPVVRLGRAVELAAKASALGEVLSWSDADATRLEAIDLTSASAPAVVFANGGSGR